MRGREFFTLLLTSILLAACASEPPPDFSEEAWLEAVKSTDISKLYAPHFNEEDGTFFNPWMLRSEQRQSGGGGRRWFFRKKPEYAPWPADMYSWKKNDYSYLSRKDFNSISYAGHSTLIIKMDGETVFTDPFFSRSALILSKNIKIKFDYSLVPDRPVVLISHNHYDHMDKKSIKALIKKHAVFIVPLKQKSRFERWGAREVYELDWWESISLGSVEYTFLPAQHWSRRLGQDGGKTLWGGWLIRGSNTVYFSGDTGYFRGFEEFGSRYEIDYAIMGAGSYEPRWFMHYQHMNPEEFIRAADDLRAKVSIPMHFGIITLSDEPLDYPLYVLDGFLKDHAEYTDRVKLLRVGEYLEM